jgi:hypothetical protein
MKGIEAAVPPGATHITLHEYPTTWVQGCAGVPNAHAGWNRETIYVNFSDTQSTAIIDSQIARVLAKSGWSRSPMRITKGQGPVPHWVRKVNNSAPIDIFAYAVPRGSSTWFFTASWQPRPVGQGCP